MFKYIILVGFLILIIALRNGYFSIKTATNVTVLSKETTRYIASGGRVNQELVVNVRTNTLQVLRFKIINRRLFNSIEEGSKGTIITRGELIVNYIKNKENNPKSS